MTDNFTDYVIQIAPPRLKVNDIGRRLLSGLLGIPTDVISIMKREASTSVLANGGLRGSETLALDERGFDRYEIDTDETVRQRCYSSWDDHYKNGFESGIIQQLKYAGYDNCYILAHDLSGTTTYPVLTTQLGNGPFNLPSEDRKTYPPSSSYWSQFIVYIPCPEQKNVIWDGVVKWGQPGITWNQEGIYWGGIKSNLLFRTQINEIKKIILDFKPVDWICREIVLIPPGESTDIFINELIVENATQISLAWTNIERWNPHN